MDIYSTTFNKLLLITVCSTLIMLGLWTIDISVSAMAISKSTGNQVLVTSGWWTRSPILQYHIGLYIIQCSALVLAAIAIYESLKSLNTRTLKNILKQIEYEETLSDQFDMEEIKNEIRNELKRRKKKWDS